MTDIFGDSPWDFPRDEDAPPAEESTTPAETPASKPVDLTKYNEEDETIEVSLPGDIFNRKYGAARITVRLRSAHRIPDIVEAVLPHIQKAYDIAGDYEAAHAPSRPTVAAGGYAAKTSVPENTFSMPGSTQLPAPMPVMGTGPAALNLLANGGASPTGDDPNIAEVQGQWGAIRFPRTSVVSTEQWKAAALQVASQVTGLPAEYLTVYDNRAEFEAGKVNGSSPGRVAFSNQVPEQVANSLVTKQGKKASVAWVKWNLNTSNIQVSETQEFTAAKALIRQFLGLA